MSRGSSADRPMRAPPRHAMLLLLAVNQQAPDTGGSTAAVPSLRSDARIAAAAAAAAAITALVTLRADFLAHPEWLALQKADFILGPVLVGLYWRRRRPASRFGLLLIVFGFACFPYVLQSINAPVPFAIGVLWEGVIGFGCAVLVLTFPTGRLEGRAARAILAVEALALLAAPLVFQLMRPLLRADGSISGCGAQCPDNGLLVAAHPSLAASLVKADRVLIVCLALATIALLGWRLATGTPPRRRAFLIGAPIAVFFELCRATYQSLMVVSPEPSQLHSVLNWTFAVARSSIWYGFLFALIAAELFAGRVLRRLVAASLRHPTLLALEAMLREPLGDPDLQLGFWDPARRAWVTGDGSPLEPPAPGSRRELTTIERDGEPAAALVHDAQLTDDPELLQAVGTVALLTLENIELEGAWTGALRELHSSRARITAAGDIERRKLERDLHDGAQQRLVAALIKLGETRRGLDDRAVRDALVALESELEQTLSELRELAHGIYPPVLAEGGLVAALRLVDHPGGITVTAPAALARYKSSIESAVYFCCLEAIQNATKHAGAHAAVEIRLTEVPDWLRFEVEDAGPGFDPACTEPGIGLRNMRDRLGAVDGRLEIVTSPGRGTIVTGMVPVGRFVTEPQRPRSVSEVR